MVACAGMLTACGGNQNKAVAPEETEATEAAVEMAFTRVNCGVRLNNAADRDKLIELGKQLVEASQCDEGVMGYDMLESVTDPMKFIVFETWKNQEVLDSHMKTPHFTSIIPQIQEIATLEIESFEQPVESVDKGNGFRLNLAFTIDPAEREAFEKYAKPLVEGSVKEEQCTGYDYFFSITKAGEGLLFEDWPSQEALDFHMQTPHFLENYPEHIKTMYKSSNVDRIYK